MSPATVATSTASSAVAYGYQRKGFYAEGLFWAFYSNGTNAGWETSPDGVDWTGSFTSIGAGSSGYSFSIWFDGTYIHYVRYASYDLFYRRGTPVNNGTITWPEVEQKAYDGESGDRCIFPCISVDTNGYAWIGAIHNKPDEDDLPVVLKNANVDGTWTTDFAYELSAVDNINWKVCPVPLTGGKVYVIYCRDTQAPLGNLWNGAAWVGEENDLADFNIQYGHLFSAVAYGDNIHFVYTKVSTYQIRHNERVWGVGWDAADVLVQDAVSSFCGPVLSIDPSANELYCFRTSTSTDHVYYKKYSSGSWGGLVDWIDESTDEMWTDYLISSFYMDYGGYIGLLYVTKTISPFNVKFDFLEFILPPPTFPPTFRVTIG